MHCILSKMSICSFLFCGNIAYIATTNRVSLFNNFARLYGRWVPGISRRLHCDQLVRRNTHNPAMSPNTKSSRDSLHLMNFQDCIKSLDEYCIYYSTLNDCYMYSTVKLSIHPKRLRSWPESVAADQACL